jgi:Transposase DDE domain
MKVDITAMIVCLDDFEKAYQDLDKHKFLPASSKQRQRAGFLSLSEIVFIVALYHFSAYKDFKHFYLFGIGHEYRTLFNKIPCYQRLIQIMPQAFLPLCLALHLLCGEETDVYFIDSTCLPVCHTKRRYKNRVFNRLESSSKSTMGWFYGFKLHLVINHKGEIMAVKITKANTDDRVVVDAMTQHLVGKMAADKGYISPPLFKKLYARGLQLIVGIRKNMKNYLMPIQDKYLLRKRPLVESVISVLKKDMDLVHSRHRSPVRTCSQSRQAASENGGFEEKRSGMYSSYMSTVSQENAICSKGSRDCEQVLNAFVHILATLVAYAFKTTKPALKTKKLLLPAYP